MKVITWVLSTNYIFSKYKPDDKRQNMYFLSTSLADKYEVIVQMNLYNRGWTKKFTEANGIS